MSQGLRAPPQQLQALQVRFFLHSGTLERIFEVTFSARFGEEYAPNMLWCGWCDKFHDRLGFSSQQCGCARESRFCLLFSQTAQSCVKQQKR